MPSPGQNQRRCLAGPLHARTGRVVWAGAERKYSELFIALRESLRRTYRAAKPLVFIVDNYIIHGSRKTERGLRDNPQFDLLFQPVYDPWPNRMARLWKAFHDAVTRNHRCQSIDGLIGNVRCLVNIVQPFRGNLYALAQLY